MLSVTIYVSSYEDLFFFSTLNTRFDYDLQFGRASPQLLIVFTVACLMFEYLTWNCWSFSCPIVHLNDNERPKLEFYRLTRGLNLSCSNRYTVE